MAKETVDDRQSDAALRVRGQAAERANAARLVEVPERVAQRLEHARLALAGQQLEQQDDAVLAEGPLRIAARAAKLPEDLDPSSRSGIPSLVSNATAASNVSRVGRACNSRWAGSHASTLSSGASSTLAISRAVVRPVTSGSAGSLVMS